MVQSQSKLVSVYRFMPLDEKRRSYIGEHEARGLVSWLNGIGSEPPSDTAKRRRIGHLVEEMNRSATLFCAGAHDEELAARIDQELTRYALKVKTLPVQNAVVTYKTVPDFRWMFGWNSNAGPRVAGAIFAITSLAERGLLGRVRRCSNCSRWYYARLNHQIFCGSRCQVAHYQNSDGWKQRRRERYHNQVEKRRRTHGPRETQ